MNIVNKYKHSELNFYEIYNKKNNFKVVLCDFAASLYEVWFNNELMTVQVEDTNDFIKEEVRLGKTIGRVAGRIANSIITIEGIKYQLQTNNFQNTLHGGHDCISQRKFQLVSESNNEKETTVTYQYISPDGEAGFPGNLNTIVTYVISNSEPSVKIIFKSTCDKTCPVSLCNHAYYCLGDENISNLNLYINADKFIWAAYKDKLPISYKEVVPCLDFRKEKSILKDIDDPYINSGVYHGYDTYYLFNELNPNIPQLILSNNRYIAKFYTDFDGTMVYSNNTLSPIKCKNTNCFIRKGLAIEPQKNQLSNLLLPPNETRTNFSKIIFSKK